MPKQASANCCVTTCLSVAAVSQAGARSKQANGGIDPEPEQKEGFVTATFDLDACRNERAGWVQRLGIWYGVG